jgi:hypothetical protein
MSSNIEIRLLQAVIALAEDLNYSKAAERLSLDLLRYMRRPYENG